ncbi:Protein of unknown function [Gryllus bimaculatus]|nr:Protein of unknown function [Gryllus bimaculatus]
MLLSASLRPESGHTAKGREPSRRPARRPMHRPEELKPNQPLRAPAQPPGERAVKVTAASTNWAECARARPTRHARHATQPNV